jgi:hypothetical protein
MTERELEMSPSEEKWWDWVDLYHARFCSVTGMPITTIYPSAGDFENLEEGQAYLREYLGSLWEIYQTGVDAVDAADKRQTPKENAADFHKNWLEEQTSQN